MHPFAHADVTIIGADRCWLFRRFTYSNTFWCLTFFLLYTQLLQVWMKSIRHVMFHIDRVSVCGWLESIFFKPSDNCWFQAICYSLLIMLWKKTWLCDAIRHQPAGLLVFLARPVVITIQLAKKGLESQSPETEQCQILRNKYIIFQKAHIQATSQNYKLWYVWRILSKGNLDLVWTQTSVFSAL